MANVLGGYELLEQIGSGATGRVWRAQKLETGALFALKELRGDLADDAEVRSRFLNEEAILADRHLPGVVRVHGTVIDGERLGLVMDLVEGPDLREVIASTGPLPPARACALARQLAETLAAAHASGLIHRDVKPANVMVVDEEKGPESALLTDFGLARVLEETGSTASRSQAFGTPDYVAPEVLEGGRAGGPADVYALGVMLFEMTLGWRPFRCRSLAALMAQHLNESPERPAGIDDQLWQVITGCLEKDPKARPKARVLGNQLKALAPKLVHVPALPRTDPPEQQPKTHVKPLIPQPTTSLPIKPAMTSRTQRIIAASVVGILAVTVTAFAASGAAGRADDPVAEAVSATTAVPVEPASTAESSSSTPEPTGSGTPSPASVPSPSSTKSSGSDKTPSPEGKSSNTTRSKSEGESAKPGDRSGSGDDDEGKTNNDGKTNKQGKNDNDEKTNEEGETKTKKKASDIYYGICVSRVKSEEVKSGYPTYRWGRCTLGAAGQVYRLYKKPSGHAQTRILLYNRNFRFYSGFMQRQWLVAPASASSRLQDAGWGGNNKESKPVLLGYGSTTKWSSSSKVQTWLKNGGRDSKNHYLQTWVSLRQGKSPTGRGYKHAEKIFYVPAG